jgi:LuxR family maltose regulon positive regulatory protein
MRIAQPVLLEIDGDDMVGWISVIHAVLMAYEGDYLRAYAELRSGLDEARERLGEGAVLCGTMSLVGAYCAVEMGQDQQAREHLAIAMRGARNNTALDLAACGFEAAVKLWDGQDDALAVADAVVLPDPPPAAIGAGGRRAGRGRARGPALGPQRPGRCVHGRVRGGAPA